MSLSTQGRMNLHDVLNELYREEVALDDDFTRQCTKVLTDFLRPVFIAKMQQADPLFKLLFREIHYGGSYYDGLRVGAATEFDLNIIIRLPFKQQDMVYDQSLAPGFAAVGITRSFDELIPPDSVNYAVYKKIAQFLGSDNKILPEKWRNWFEGVCFKARENSMAYLPQCNIGRIILRRSGPALTLEITSSYGTVINVDLVPVIHNEATTFDDVMYCVPKAHRENMYLWRCSFPLREKQLLLNGGCAKMIIRLLKKLRDKQGWHKLASYYLKTVVMLMKGDEAWGLNKIDDYFIATLKKLSFYLSQGGIPFYHNHGCNLLRNVNASTISNINGRLVRIIKDFEIAKVANPSIVKKYF